MDSLETLIEGQPAELAKTVRGLAHLIGHRYPDLNTAIKWRQLTYAVDSDFHHWICAIGTTKRAVGLTFHFGGLLDDPEERLLAGSSKLLPKLEFRSAADVDDDVVCTFIDQAIDRLDFFREHWRELS